MTLRRAAILAIAAALLAVLEACANPFLGNGTYRNLLYMTDSVNGRIYTYDPTTHESASTSLLSIGRGAAGAIAFYQGIGFVAVGANGSNLPGLYWFDPSAVVPVATRIGESVSAQYVDIVSPTKGYLTVAEYGNTAPPLNGVYTFDPSDPAAGLSGPISGTTSVNGSASTYPQDIAAGPDSMIYVADYYNGDVMQIDPSTDSVTKTFLTSAGGTTGLAVGSYNGAEGVYVANSGGYGSSGSALPGSIDFIDATNGSIQPVTSAISASGAAIYPSQLLMASSTSLIAIGYSQTLLISASGGATSELLADGASFGGSDIALVDGEVYIADGNYGTKTSELYVMSTSGTQASYSPVTVMKSGQDCIADIARYQ